MNFALKHWCGRGNKKITPPKGQRDVSLQTWSMVGAVCVPSQAVSISAPLLSSLRRPSSHLSTIQPLEATSQDVLYERCEVRQTETEALNRIKWHILLQKSLGVQRMFSFQVIFSFLVSLITAQHFFPPLFGTQQNPPFRLNGAEFCPVTLRSLDGS